MSLDGSRVIRNLLHRVTGNVKSSPRRKLLSIHVESFILSSSHKIYRFLSVTTKQLSFDLTVVYQRYQVDHYSKRVRHEPAAIHRDRSTSH